MIVFLVHFLQTHQLQERGRGRGGAGEGEREGEREREWVKLCQQTLSHQLWCL